MTCAGINVAGKYCQHHRLSCQLQTINLATAAHGLFGNGALADFNKDDIDIDCLLRDHCIGSYEQGGMQRYSYARCTVMSRAFQTTLPSW